MRRWLIPILVTAAALALVGVLGSAGAQTQTTTVPAATPQRTITVNGFAEQAVPGGAGPEAVQTAYRGALAAALDDAGPKAQLLAEKAGVGLGGLQSIVELSDGDIYACPVGDVSESPPAKGGKPSRRPKRRRGGKAKGRPTKSARTAQDTGGCPVIASVAVTYAIG